MMPRGRAAEHTIFALTAFWLLSTCFCQNLHIKLEVVSVLGEVGFEGIHNCAGECILQAVIISVGNVTPSSPRDGISVSSAEGTCSRGSTYCQGNFWVDITRYNRVEFEVSAPEGHFFDFIDMERIDFQFQARCEVGEEMTVDAGPRLNVDVLNGWYSSTPCEIYSSVALVPTESDRRSNDDNDDILQDRFGNERDTSRKDDGITGSAETIKFTSGSFSTSVNTQRGSRKYSWSWEGDHSWLKATGGRLEIVKANFNAGSIVHVSKSVLFGLGIFVSVLLLSS